MFWEDIVGHKESIAVLRRLVDSNRMPHALLLVGQAGIGKGLVALALATAILCQSGKDKPCGACASCRKIKPAHPDLFHFVANGETLKIEQMRELQSAASLSPIMGDRRVVIIEDAERLTLPAANSLLKILEEPSQSLLFIITAKSIHSLLSTIVSRCRVLRLAPVPADELAAALTNRGYPLATAGVAARLSGGRLGRALAFLEPDGMAARDKALAVLRNLPNNRSLSSWNGLVGLEGGDFAAMLEWVEQLALLLRDVLLIHTHCEEKLLLNRDISQELAEIAAGWTRTGICSAVRETLETCRALASNANTRLTCEALLLRLEEYYSI